MTEERNPKEIGMRDVPKNLRPYFLGLLRRGPRWNEIEGPEAAELLPRHLAYLREQSEAGRYKVAGPVLNEITVRSEQGHQARRQTVLRFQVARPGPPPGRMQAFGAG